DRLERRDRTLALAPSPQLTPEGVAPGVAEMGELEEAQANGQVEPCPSQQDHERRAPHDAVDRIVEREKLCGHRKTPLHLRERCRAQPAPQRRTWTNLPVR